jgi:hypothetical protein
MGLNSDTQVRGSSCGQVDSETLLCLAGRSLYVVAALKGHRLVKRLSCWLAAAFALISPAYGDVLYTFEKVGGNSDGLFSISAETAMNDAGDILFFARVGPLSTFNALLVWRGGAFDTIAATEAAGGQFTSLNVPISARSINNAGQSVFRGGLPDGSVAIFVDDNDVLSTLATSSCAGCEFANVSQGPTINEAGLVAFHGTATGVNAILTRPASGGPANLIADSGDGTPFRAFSLLGGGLGLSMNAAGDVAFRAVLQSGINDDGIFIGHGNNVITTVAMDGGLAPQNETFVSLSHPSLNDAGDVAFCANLSNNESGIFLWRGGTLSVIADTMGTFNGFTFPDNGLGCTQVSIPTLNNAGQVVFEGGTHQGGEALYLWDGALQRVIGLGDEIGGGEIDALSFFGGGFNAFGDIAFAGELQGVDPIFIARAARDTPPVPEPATLLLLVPGLAFICFARRRSPVPEKRLPTLSMRSSGRPIAGPRSTFRPTTSAVSKPPSRWRRPGQTSGLRARQASRRCIGPSATRESAAAPGARSRRERTDHVGRTPLLVAASTTRPARSCSRCTRPASRTPIPPSSGASRICCARSATTAPGT